MATIGEFLEALKQKDNFSGNYALGVIESSAPKDRWEITLGEELTSGMAAALLDALSLPLEDVKGYYETDEGQELIGTEIAEFVSDFGSIALGYGVQLADHS